MSPGADIPFKARAVKDGGNGEAVRITIPAETAQTFLPVRPCWVRLRLGTSWYFAYVRRAPSRACAEVCVPSWIPERPQPGRTFSCAFTPADDFRAQPIANADGFDWLPFVDSDRYFPTEDEDGALVIWNRYEEPFRMRRVTPLEETYRLLGWYQAEGSKGATGHDFTFATSNPATAAYYTQLLLRVFDLERERLCLEILRGPSQAPDEARALFADIDVPISAERIRPGAGGHAGVLHIRKSQPIRRAVCAALGHVFDEGFRFPSKEAARAYALGWMDGDATITIGRQQENFRLQLRLAGHNDEQKVVLAALEQGFGWKLPDGKFGTPQDYTSRTLRLDQAADLAAAGAFATSMSRARLIWGLEKRLTARNERATQRGRTLTTDEDVTRAEMIFYESLEAEAARLRKHPQANNGFNTGEKGLPYPL